MENLMRVSDIFFPSNIKCIFCGEECNSGVSICSECLTKLPYITGKTCSKCGGRVLEEDTCIDCSKDLHSFAKNYCVFDYDGVIRDKILAFKKYGRRHIGEVFSIIMLDKFIKCNIPCDIIIPMPIHKSREKERGFNQSDILVKDIADYTGRVKYNIIEKVINTPHQTGLSRENRKTNLDGAFRVVDKSAIKGKTILVIDDIYTTGSTMAQVSDTLLKSGAKSVYGMCLARAKINIE